MITSRYLGSPPAPLRTLYCPLEEFSRRASYSTGRLATTPETDADLTEESGSNGLCLERQADLPEGHKCSASKMPEKLIGRLPSRRSVYGWHCARIGRLRSGGS